MPKKVFVAILRPPVGSTYFAEGLRLALGVIGGDEEHHVTIACIGKGVNCARKGVDISYATEFLEFLPKNAAGKTFYVEKESLEDERIPASEVDENFAVVSRDELREKMLQADATFSF